MIKSLKIEKYMKMSNKYPSLAKISWKRGHSKYLDKFILSGLNYALHQHAPEMNQSLNSRLQTT